MLAFLGKDLIHHRGQTLFNIIGLAVVVFAALILVALAETMDRMLADSAGARNLVILQGDAAVVDESRIEPEVFQAVADLTPAVIVRSSPMIFRTLRLDDALVQLRAAPLADWESVFQLQLVSGRWPDGRAEIAVGEGAFRAYGWGQGARLTIYGTMFTVTGVFRSPGVVYASLWMPLEAAQDLFAPRRDSQMLMVQLAAGRSLEEVRQKLEAHPGLEEAYAVFYEDSVARRNTRVLADIALLVRIVAAVALASVLFGTYNLTHLSLEERRGDAGVLLAVGFSNGALVLVLVIRALLLGLAAYLLALLSAWAYLSIQGALSPIYLHGLLFILDLSPTNALTMLAGLVLLPVLGAWLSARSLLRQRVVSVLGKVG